MQVSTPTSIVHHTDNVDTGSHADSYERNSSGVHELARLWIGPIALRLTRITRMIYRTECFDTSLYADSYERNSPGGTQASAPMTWTYSLEVNANHSDGTSR